MTIPNYLREYRSLYRRSPRTAALAWFAEARYGLFLHYGLYSLLGRHEWVQHREQIPVAEYEKLADQFTAENFDATAIVDFAVSAGMRYVNLTTRHHDSFCLFETAQTDFHSVNAPAGRDLVGELAAACDERGIGLMLYYSHGRDWRHPHAPNNDLYPDSAARPEYQDPEPAYATGDDHDLDKYLDFMSAQITELLTNYGAVGGIWLDGIATPRSGDSTVFKVQELYHLVHDLQPQALVAYKQGYLGTEDYMAPEHRAVPTRGVPGEICTTMELGSWGYRADGGPHRTADMVWDELTKAGEAGVNLLLNTGPLPDGSLDERDVPVLQEVGERLRKEGFPGA